MYIFIVFATEKYDFYLMMHDDSQGGGTRNVYIYGIYY